jgi:RNA polymerase sigma-54 factor
MAFELRQNLKLSQQLVMTPQLQQAIKLLQLSRLELVDQINQELEENPLLEEVAPDEFPDERGGGQDVDETRLHETEETKPIAHTQELTGEGDGKSEFDWDNYLEDYGPMGVTYDRSDAETHTWDNLLTSKPTLTDHLMWQLKLSPLTTTEMRIGEQIIGNIDPNGYLAATLGEIAEQEKVDETAVEAVLRKVQEFDPPGIAARNLGECLLLQARMTGLGTPLIERIITGHLRDLEMKNYGQIARKLKVDLDEVMQAVQLIRNMDPKPGSPFSEDRTQPITPDVFVVKSGDDYKVILNDEGLPRLRISNFYREVMASQGHRPDAEIGKRYIKDRVQSATWLIKSIQQRQRTILKVTESIVRFQRAFFDNGVNFMKPLILRDVADDVEMHESTISRVVTNKYMHSPRGIFELKYFFGSSLYRTTGEAVASKSVKEDIRMLIAAENPKKPLSDSEIAKRLSARGIGIARRTVAKYREMMGILPSSRRKNLF